MSQKRPDEGKEAPVITLFYFIAGSKFYFQHNSKIFVKNWLLPSISSQFDEDFYDFEEVFLTMIVSKFCFF